MGVYDGDGDYVEGTVLDRRAGEQGAPIPRELFPAVEKSEQPEAIYAGPLYVHYGHFLLESLARAWYAHQHPDVPVVWAGAHNWQAVELSPWQAEILDILGITNPTRIVADPVRVRAAARPGYRLPLRRQVPPRARRSSWAGTRDRCRFRDTEIVAVPQHGGQQRPRPELRGDRTAARVRRVDLARPEALSMRQQLDHLARASIVAGEEGSAFHSLVLLKNVAAKKFHVFRRFGREHKVSHHREGPGRRPDLLHARSGARADGGRALRLQAQPQLLGDLGQPPGAGSGRLRSRREVHRNRAPPACCRRLQAAELSRDRCLHSVLGCRIDRADSRRGVSALRLRSRTYADSGVDFYELEITQYADHFHADRGPFDLVRIAGSNFEQIMASFHVSRRLAHEGTTWILGSGDLAARAALAIRLAGPGFTGKRLFVQQETVFVAQRVAGEPLDEAHLAELPPAEVKKRIRRLPRARARRWRGLQGGVSTD